MTVPDGMSRIEAQDISHALLVALLAEHHGGTAVLPIASVESAAGDAEGRLWSLMIDPMDGGTHVRVSVVHVARRDPT